MPDYTHITTDFLALATAMDGFIEDFVNTYGTDIQTRVDKIIARAKYGTASDKDLEYIDSLQILMVLGLFKTMGYDQFIEVNEDCFHEYFRCKKINRTILIDQII